MDEKKKLYETLVAKGLYTKSYEEFIAKYSDKESVDNMYKVVSDKGLYTKDQESFSAKYFSDLKKKEETISQEPSQISTEPVQEPSQISTESVQEPIKSPLISSESKPSQEVDSEITEPTRTEDQAQLGVNSWDLAERKNSQQLEEQYQDPGTSSMDYMGAGSQGALLKDEAFKLDKNIQDTESRNWSYKDFLSAGEKAVAMDIFKKSVDRYADPEGPVDNIGGDTYKMQMQQMVRMGGSGREAIQDEGRVKTIIGHLEELHNDAINKNSRNAREVGQKQKENSLIKDFGKEFSETVKSSTGSNLWGQEDFAYEDTKDKGLDRMIKSQLLNEQFYWQHRNMERGYVLMMEEKIKANKQEGLMYAYKMGDIKLKNPLKEERYKGYVTGQLSAGAKEYAYTKDMQDIKWQERRIGDFSDESAGAFGGESFDVLASRRKKAVTVVNREMDFEFMDNYMTTHEVKISEWIDKLSDLKKKVKSEDISENEKAKLQNQIAVTSKRIKDARYTGADLLFDPVTGESVVANKASEEAINLQKEIDLKSVLLTGNTRTDLQNMRRDLYWRFQYLDSEVTRNYDEVLADAPMFGQLIKTDVDWFRNFQDGRVDIEKALPLFGGTPLLDEYKETYEEMIAVNRALMLNEDPGTIERDLLGTFAEGLREATVADRDYSQDDIIEGFGSAMNEYGVELSQSQKDRIKDSFGEEVTKGIAGTIPEVAKFIAISVATEGLGIGAAFESAFTAMKLATKSRTAKALLTFIEPTLKMEMQFQLAGQDAGTGAGEAIGQMGYDALGIDKLLNTLPFTKKWKAIVNTVLKTAAGAGGEWGQEYTGEMLNRLVEGEEFGDALLNTIGDDPARKALATYLISLTMSVGTMGSNYKKSMKIMEDNVINQVSSDPEVVAAQKKIIEERGKELKDAKGKVEEGSSELDKINKQIQDLEGIKGKLYGDFSGGVKEEGDVVNITETEGELSNYTVDGKVRSDKQIIENLNDPKFVEKVKSGKANLDIQNPSPEVKTALEESGVFEAKVKQDVKEEITPKEEVVETPTKGEQQTTESVEITPTKKKVTTLSNFSRSYSDEGFGKEGDAIDSRTPFNREGSDYGKESFGNVESTTLKAKNKEGYNLDKPAVVVSVAAPEVTGGRGSAVGFTIEAETEAEAKVLEKKAKSSFDKWLKQNAEFDENGKMTSSVEELTPKVNEFSKKLQETLDSKTKTKQDEQTRSTDGTVLDKKESQQSAKTKKPKFQKSKETQEDLQQGKDEAKLLKEGKTTTTKPVKIFKGLGGKKDLSGARINAHEGAEGVFSSIDESEAADYGREEGVSESVLPEGTTMEVVEVDGTGMTPTEYRKAEVEAINNSDAQVVKLVTVDGVMKKGARKQEQYIIKDPKLIEDVKKTKEQVPSDRTDGETTEGTSTDQEAGGKKTGKEKVKVFRGRGKNYAETENEGFDWVATDKATADEYSNIDGSGNLTTEERDIDKPENVFELPYKNPNQYVTGENIANHFRKVMNQKIKKGEIKEEQWREIKEKINEYEKEAGGNVEMFHTKINKPKASKLASSILSNLGYDAISIKEGGETTYGLIKKEAGGKKTGKERLKAAVKEYSESQKKESEDFRDKAEAKPKAPRDARKVFKKQNAGEVDNLTKKAKTEGKKKALGTIKNIIKALGSINPDLEVVVHETEQSYLEEMGKEAKGTSGVLATDGKIHLNLSKIKDNTALHEAAHVVMAAHMKANPEAITEFKGQLEGILSKSDVDSLTDFSNEYESDGKQTVNEEFVIEALSRIANGSIVLTKTRLDKLKALLRNLAKKLGMTPSQIKLTGKEDVIRFSEKLTEAFSEGREITTEAYKVEGGKVKFQKTKKESKLFREPNKDVIKVSEKYKKDNNIDTTPAEKIYELDLDNSKEIADAYENMTDNPSDPKVKKAYTALANEVTSQFNALIDAGFEVEIYEGKGEPYANSEEVLKDLKENKKLRILSTESDFGDGNLISKDNPMLQDSGLTDSNGKPLLVNDLFRFVHDVYGHGEQGTSFGAIGEENAWNVHSKLFGDDARRALTTETRGQNSWVNFGPHMRNPDGSIKKKGDPGYLPPSKRPFAKQKNGLLPDSMVFPERAKSEKKVEVVNKIKKANSVIIERNPDLKKVVENINIVLESLGTTVDKVFSGGGSGIAMLLKNGDVLKITNDTKELNLINAVIENPSKGVAKYKSVSNIKGNSYSVVVMENLTTLSIEEQGWFGSRKTNLLNSKSPKEFMSEIKRFTHINSKESKEWFAKHPWETQETMAELYEKNKVSSEELAFWNSITATNIENIQKSAKDFNLNSTEIRGDNVGFSGKTLVLFDSQTDKVAKSSTEEITLETQPTQQTSEVEAEVDVTETSPELKKVYEDIDRILGRKPGTTKTASKRSLNVNINKLKRKADAIRKQAEADKKSLEHVVEELGRPISVAEAQALIKAGKTPKKSIPQLIEEKKANIRKLAGQLGSTANMGVGPNGFKLIGELISLAKLQIIQGGSTFKAFLKSLPFPLSKTVRKIWNAARLGINSNYKSKRVTFGVKNLNTRQAQNYYLESKDHMEPVTSVDNLLSQLDEIISINQIRIDSTLDAYKKRQLEKANAELIKEYNTVRLKRVKKGVDDADVLAALNIKLDDKFEAVTEDSKMSFEYESLSFWETVIKAGIVDSQYAQKRVQKLIKDQTGEGVSASKDPYILNDLQKGKVQRKIEKIMDYIAGERFGHVSLSAVGIAAKSTKKDSLIGRMKSKDISRDELGRFMLFRHVKERNKRMETLREQAREEAIEASQKDNNRTIADLQNQDLPAKELKKQLKKAADTLEGELKKIDKNLPILENRGYCGVTDKKAQEYLDKIDPVKKENMTEFAKEYKENVLDKTVDIYLEAGLINKENADALKNGTDAKTGDKFDFYVPMKVNGDIINDIIEASGVTSESSKRNKDGLRSLEAASKSNKFKAFDRVNPFDQGLYDMQYAIVKAEQNETRKALLDMVQKNKNKDLWEVYREYPPGYKLEDYDLPRVPFGVDPSSLVTVKKDGKTFLIRIKDADLRDSWVDDAGKSAALRAAASMYNVLNKISSRFMNFKRSILTTLNPSFAIPNLTRDVQDALFNLTGLEDKGLQGEFLKSIPGAMKGFAQSKHGKKDKKWAKVYQEMADYGGEISWMHLGDVSETINDINERINKGWWTKTKRVSGAQSIVDGIELFNSTLEQGTRVAIYKAVSDKKIMDIKKGIKKWKNLSKQELANISEAEVKKEAPEAFKSAKTAAAAAAKNVTINFNRKGHLGGIINSVWMFSNAGFQGASTGLNTLTTKRGRRFAGKIMIFGAAYRAMLASLTDDEDWQKIESRYDLENNFVLPIDLSTGECITIPKSYGPMRSLINIGGYLWDAGVKAYDGKFGAGVSDAIWRTANEAHKIMDPISGSSDNVLSSYTPEIVKPIVENWTNRNYRDKKIVPNRYHKPDGSIGYLRENQEMDKPDRLKYYDDIHPAFITMAQYNPFGDVSPEELEHLFEGYVYSGVVKDLGNMAVDIGSNELELSNAPIIKRFYKKPSEEQRTWRKRSKIDELTILSNKEEFSADQIALFKSLLTDLYPIEAQGVYGKLANKNRAARKREWRSMQENQVILKKENE